MNERKSTDFSQMSKWPEDAKELPDSKPRRTYRNRWGGLWAGLGIGVALTVIRLAAGGDAPVLLANAAAYGAVGFLIGYTIDRREERLDRIHNR